MNDRIWSDINNTSKMSNRFLPVFPVTETIQEGEKFTQRTVGGNTKFEQAVFQIAQGLAQNPNVHVDDIDMEAFEITNRIFDRIDNIK